jgi:Radical SAM superfamily
MKTAELADTFTSRGNKFWNHPESLEGLRNGKPRPVVTHLMLTDTCQHSCAFCSVQTREGNSLSMIQIRDYLDQLIPIGLKSVILSGGGNPILYKNDIYDFNDAVDLIYGRGLEIGVITNGMPMKKHPDGRTSWKNVRPETLDKLTWVRISMSGLDHKENEVYVPDIDRSKTTLGFSYVYHDIYEVPEEPNHGKVSTEYDLNGYAAPESIRLGEDRFETIRKQIADIVGLHHPEYVRLLPNCLEPEKIAARCDRLREMAQSIDPKTVFVQFKPPEAPAACWLGYLHPVLNSDGYVYPCDSCVLNRAAGHKFAEPWRICRWDEIGEHFSKPARSLIKNPSVTCPGCVFTKSNQLLQTIVDGAPLQPPSEVQHPNFV